MKTFGILLPLSDWSKQQHLRQGSKLCCELLQIQQLPSAALIHPTRINIHTTVSSWKPDSESFDTCLLGLYVSLYALMKCASMVDTDPQWPDVQKSANPSRHKSKPIWTECYCPHRSHVTLQLEQTHCSFTSLGVQLDRDKTQTQILNDREAQIAKHSKGFNRS